MALQLPSVALQLPSVALQLPSVASHAERTSSPRRHRRRRGKARWAWTGHAPILQTVISGAQLYGDKDHLGKVVRFVLGWCRGRLGHTFALVQSSVSAANNYTATKSNLDRIARRVTRLGLSLCLTPSGISGAKVDYCGGTDLREVAQTEGQLLAESKHEGDHPLVCGMRYIQGVDHWIYPVAQEAVNAVPAEKQAAGANTVRVA